LRPERYKGRRTLGAWRVFFQNPLAVLGLVIILLFASMVVIHPLLMATLWAGEGDIYDPLTGYDAPVVERVVVATVTDPSTEVALVEARLKGDISANVGDRVMVTLQPAPPSGTHWLGTDTFGRDVFSMMLAGAWPTFIVGIGAALVSATLGTLMAVASAVFRGGTDRLLSKISDVLLLFPAPLAMIVLAGGTTTEFLTPLNFGVVYGVLAGGSTVAIVLRSHALTTVERPFIDAARVSGARGWYLAWRHLVPHMIPLAAATGAHVRGRCGGSSWIRLLAGLQRRVDQLGRPDVHRRLLLQPPGPVPMERVHRRGNGPVALRSRVLPGLARSQGRRLSG
jgi:ABC-type dipeptide/oligopeptide/nickel transport system permease subunit